MHTNLSHVPVALRMRTTDDDAHQSPSKVAQTQKMKVSSYRSAAGQTQVRRVLSADDASKELNRMNAVAAGIWLPAHVALVAWS